MSDRPVEHRAKIAEARNVLGEVISRARYAEEPTILINRGKEAAVIVSYGAYERAKLHAQVVARLRDLSDDPQLMARVHELDPDMHLLLDTGAI